MLFREALGEILREERLSKGKSMRQVSEKACMALGYLSEVERGRKELSSEILERIAKHGLAIEVNEIILSVAMRMAGIDVVPDTVAELVDQYSDLVAQ